MIFIVKLVNASQKISQKLANMFVFRTNKGALYSHLCCGKITTISHGGINFFILQNKRCGISSLAKKKITNRATTPIPKKFYAERKSKRASGLHRTANAGSRKEN